MTALNLRSLFQMACNTFGQGQHYLEWLGATMYPLALSPGEAYYSQEGAMDNIF